MQQTILRGAREAGANLRKVDKKQLGYLCRKQLRHLVCLLNNVVFLPFRKEKRNTNLNKKLLGAPGRTTRSKKLGTEELPSHSFLALFSCFPKRSVKVQTWTWTMWIVSHESIAKMPTLGLRSVSLEPQSDKGAKRLGIL